MLVRVNGANEDVREIENAVLNAPARPKPTTIGECINEDTGYPFIQEDEERRCRNNPNGNQLALRIQSNGLTIEFFGNHFYACKNFAVFMEKMGGKCVSSR